MKILILGQPRSGKSTLSKILSEQLKFPTICTDNYRLEWNFHKPLYGYDTEIDPSNQMNFYNQLKEVYEKYDNLILEGSAINPKDSYLFNPDIVILLSRKSITAQKMFEDSRKYDNDWTKSRSDEYLYNLFENYIRYSQEWAKENKEILVDTTNYLEGINIAKRIIISKIDDIKNKQEL